jgi:hypothetical protein
MRFLTSKFGFFIISLLFIFCLIWINLGNLTNSSLVPGNTDPQKIFFNKLGDFLSSFLKWVFDTARPIAAEASQSIQTWWQAQKPIIAGQLIQWFSQSKNSIASSLLP